MSEKVSSFLSNLPAFDQMVQAQKQVINEAKESSAAQAAAAAAESLMQTKLQATVDAAYVIAAADGSTSPSEVTHIASKMSAATSNVLTESDVQDMIGISAKKLGDSGQEALIAKMASTITDATERETAFSVAAAVSWTGGGIGVKEGLALQAISRAFGWEMNHMHKLLGKARG
jgi:tellurite resistance protein